MTISRRRVLKGIAGLTPLLLPWSCQEQASTGSGCIRPTGQPVRWLVPFPAGGGYDAYSRLIAPTYSRHLGVDVTVENVAGAAGLIAASTLVESAPDGQTLGILNTPGLLVASLAGDTGAPNPAEDLSILGSVAPFRQVLVAGGNSPLQTMDDVLAASRLRPILFAISEISSNTFISMVVTADLFGIPTGFIAGFGSSRESSLAVIRGEADLTCYTFESIVDRIEAGDMTPILQIGAERISSHPSLDGVPLLGGENGVAAVRARETGRDANQAAADAQLLSALAGIGMAVAAPPGMDDALFRCLEEALYRSLTSPELLSAASRANRTIEAERAERVRTEIRNVATELPRLLPLVNDAIDGLRNRG